MTAKTLLSWSTGKDSTWTLHQMQESHDIEVCGLFCTINKEFQRTAMHAVRVELLKSQAQKLKLPLDIVEIPSPCSNTDYESIMGEYVSQVRKRDVQHFAFGDLFLEDIRQYRTDKLKQSGIDPLFPIWDSPTDKLARDMVDWGIEAIVTCIDPAQLDPKFVGRNFDHKFLDDLPDGVDHCGENGEFHTFVFNAPNFSSSIEVYVGEKLERDGFHFADVMAKTT